MRLLDGDRLLAHLHEGQDRALSEITEAVYAGLELRVTRGDFDAPDVAHDLGSRAETRTAPESAATLTRSLDNHLLNRRPSQ